MKTGEGWGFPEFTILLVIVVVLYLWVSQLRRIKKLCVRCHTIDYPKRLKRGNERIEIWLCGLGITNFFGGFLIIIFIGKNMFADVMLTIGFIILIPAMLYSLWRTAFVPMGCSNCKNTELVLPQPP